jgi:pentatricopeptide repeat protein
MSSRFNIVAFLLLATQQTQTASGLLPSSNCRSNPPNWGLSSLSRQTRLAVSSDLTKINVADGEDEYLEIEGAEDYDIDEILLKKQEWVEELERLARSSSRDSAAISQAQAIFDEMFEAFVKTEDSAVFPDTDVYNLLIETHAYGRLESGGDEANLILSKMEDDSTEFVARPNLKTYLNVMDAWAMQKESEKVEATLQRLQERYSDTNDESLKPSIEVYNKLIKAYGIQGEIEKAEIIFRNSLEEEGDLKANQKSWVQIMKAYTSLKEGPKKVQALFQEMQKAHRMGEEEYLPKTEAYNTLIRALGQKKNGGGEAEAMLFEMIDQYRNGDHDMRPNTDSFRNTIEAQTFRKNLSGVKVEQLLQIQDGLYESTQSPDLKPDGRLNNAAMAVISKSRDSKKAVRSKRLVEKMKNSGDPNNLPSRKTYYFLLSACAFTRGSPEENFEAFQVAVDTLKELKEYLGEEPDSSCIGMFLKACANLMPVSRKRDTVVGSIFKKACDDGLLNDFVLSEFERAASDTLQLEILGGFIDDDVRMPQDWSRNVKNP